MKPNPAHSVQRFGTLRRRVRQLRGYDIGNARLAKGRIEQVRESATQDLKKAQNTPMSPSSRWLPGARTTTILTTPRTFDEVGLNWIEYYHKSDNINLRTLNVSLWSNNYWELTDVMPLSLDSLFPYIGQVNLDYADYENLPTGMNFYVTELDGTPSHSFDPAGNWTTSGNWDWFGVAINQTQAKLHIVAGGCVSSESMQVGRFFFDIPEDNQHVGLPINFWVGLLGSNPDAFLMVKRFESKSYGVLPKEGNAEGVDFWWSFSEFIEALKGTWLEAYAASIWRSFAKEPGAIWRAIQKCLTGGDHIIQTSLWNFISALLVTGTNSQTISYEQLGRLLGDLANKVCNKFGPLHKDTEQHTEEMWRALGLYTSLLRLLALKKWLEDRKEAIRKQKDSWEAEKRARYEEYKKGRDLKTKALDERDPQLARIMALEAKKKMSQAGKDSDEFSDLYSSERDYKTHSENFDEEVKDLQAKATKDGVWLSELGGVQPAGTMEVSIEKAQLFRTSGI